jgi:hypothetical protein
MTENTTATVTATDDTAVVEKAVARRGEAKTGNPQSDRKANAIKASKKAPASAPTTTTVKGINALQAAAVERGIKAGNLKATATKTTATFEGTAKEAATAIRTYQEVLAAEHGRVGGDYAALHAVARKLENGKDITEGPKMVKVPGLDVEVPVPAEAPAAEKAPAKKAPAQKAPSKKAPLKPVTPTSAEAAKKVPAGYVPRYTHKSYDLYSTVPGEGKIKWLTVCNAHATYTEADGGRDGDVKGTSTNRPTWCKGCETDAKKAEKAPAEKAPAAKKAPAKKTPAAK